MPRTRRLIGAVASFALLAGAATTPAFGASTGDTSTHEVGHVVFTGKVKGILVFKGVSQSRTRMYLSLHNLRRNTAYDVVASTRPCGQSLTGPSRIFGLDVHASRATDNWQSILLGVAYSRVSTMRSLRLIGDALDGTRVPTRCESHIELESVSF
jgi:hypothetical protein